MLQAHAADSAPEPAHREAPPLRQEQTLAASLRRGNSANQQDQERQKGGKVSAFSEFRLLAAHAH